MECSKTPPDEPEAERMTRGPRVPVTVLAPECQQTDLLRRLAADGDNFVIASEDTLASNGLLGLIRVGRAAVVAPDVTSRTLGCKCCQLRVDLVDAIRHAVLRRSPPRRLIAVVDRATTSGCDRAYDDDPTTDVVTCIHTVQADSEIERLASLDGVVVEVDARSASTRLASGFRLWSAQTEAALAIADRIVVTDARLLTTSARTALKQELRMVNRIGRVSLDSPTETIVDDLVDLDAWHRAPQCGVGSPSALSSATDPGTPAIDTVVLRRHGVLNPDAADAWLDQVVAVAPSRLLRFQAALRVSTHEHRVCFRGSRSVLRSQSEHDPAGMSPGEPRRDGDSVVVLIGRELDRHALSEGFASIEATR
jgi:G3E family GTPase